MAKSQTTVYIRPQVKEAVEQASAWHSENKIDIYTNIIAYFLMQAEDEREKMLQAGQYYANLFEAELPFIINEGFEVMRTVEKYVNITKETR